MKIGLLIYGSLDSLSGGYLYDRMLVEYLRKQGDTVEIISLPWRNYAAHLTDNFTFRLPLGLDVLIQDELNHPSLLWANRKKPYPVVSLVHHLRCSELRPKWQNWFYRVIEKRYLKSVDGFIFNSRTTKSVVSSAIDIQKPSMVAYPPTDRFGIQVTTEEIKTRAQASPLKILFLGNVIERKGLHTLLDALSILNTEHWSLDIVGSLTSNPAYAAAMREKASGLSASVHFHGALDNAPLVERLRAAHLLVVPSSYEGFGIVYLEGMGFGLPAIGTTAGAAGEIIEEDKNGYLIEPGDHKMLAVLLQKLAKDRSMLEELSSNALANYRLFPNWEHTAGEIRSFLSEISKQKSAS